MNALGLSLLVKMGCFCSRDVVYVNGTKYEVRERIGEGGFSTIDLVENTFSKKQFALKRITCHSVEDQRAALQEIEYYKILRHPNVIELIESTFKGSADIVMNATSEVYMVLPYYRKGTLHDYLNIRSLTNSLLQVADILRLFYYVCDAVKYLHEFTPEPLAHRDLKTANVCLTDDLNPIVMDLGSVAPAKVQVCGSQDAQKLQDIAAEKCSMPYRAPELFNVESYCVIDQRTDIWSLGCILYALCYLKSPFDAVYERGDSVALAVLSGSVSFPEDSPFGQDIHELIDYMLRVNPSERPFIQDVIERVSVLRNKIDNRV